MAFEFSEGIPQLVADLRERRLRLGRSSEQERSRSPAGAGKQIEQQLVTDVLGLCRDTAKNRK